LDVVKYLREGFGLDKSDAQARDNYALIWSASNGHLDVVKYLKEGFGLDRSDAQADHVPRTPRDVSVLISSLKRKLCDIE
jgi:ankyrin repeat protein